MNTKNKKLRKWLTGAGSVAIAAGVATTISSVVSTSESQNSTETVTRTVDVTNKIGSFVDMGDHWTDMGQGSAQWYQQVGIEVNELDAQQNTTHSAYRNEATETFQSWDSNSGELFYPGFLKHSTKSGNLDIFTGTSAPKNTILNVGLRNSAYGGISGAPWSDTTEGDNFGYPNVITFTDFVNKNAVINSLTYTIDYEISRNGIYSDMGARFAINTITYTQPKAIKTHVTTTLNITNRVGSFVDMGDHWTDINQGAAQWYQQVGIEVNEFDAPQNIKYSTYRNERTETFKASNSDSAGGIIVGGFAEHRTTVGDSSVFTGTTKAKDTVLHVGLRNAAYAAGSTAPWKTATGPDGPDNFGYPNAINLTDFVDDDVIVNSFTYTIDYEISRNGIYSDMGARFAINTITYTQIQQLDDIANPINELSNYVEGQQLSWMSGRVLYFIGLPASYETIVGMKFATIDRGAVTEGYSLGGRKVFIRLNGVEVTVRNNDSQVLTSSIKNVSIQIDTDDQLDITDVTARYVQ